MLIPLGEVAETFPDPDLRAEAVVALERAAVRVGDRHVAGLHADKLAMTCEVIVFWQNTGADQLLLKRGDVVQKVFGCAAADVVDGVGRQREAVFAGLSLRGTLHDAEDALNDVVDVGEVALHVAVVEDLDRAALGERVGGGEVKHVRAACGSVDREEAEAGGRDIVELAVAVGQELVGFFSGRVEGDRVVDFVFHCECKNLLTGYKKCLTFA